MLHDVAAIITALGAASTAIAVVVGVFQLRAAKEEARTSFEDDLSREYRAIVGTLPAEAFYVKTELALTESTRPAFYRYVDLSNEQLFLARLGRIDSDTERHWRDGIKAVLEGLPAFRAAWSEIADKAPDDFFEDLRKLVPPDAPEAADSKYVDGASAQPPSF